MTTTERMDVDQRKEVLERDLTTQITQGKRVEYRGDFHAVVLTGRRVNHLLHALLTAGTLGVWGIFWIAFIVLGGEICRACRSSRG